MKKVNYGKLLTEQANPRTRAIDTLSTEKILTLISREDQSVPLKVAQARKQIARGVGLMVKAVKNGGRVFFAGAGTSGRLGVLEAAECPPTFNTPPSLIQAVMAGGKSSVFRSKEGAEDKLEDGLEIFRKKMKSGDILVGIAASGVTPFVKGALQAAKEKNASAILVTCADGSLLKNLCDCVIAVKTGPEVISGSTRLKAGTATKLVLNMLTVGTMVQLGKVYQNWMVDLQPRSKKLEARALRLISRLGQVPENRAEIYLKQSGKKVKVAILMARKKWPRPKAVAALKKTRGFLKRALLEK